MVAAFIRRTGILLLAMQQDGGRKLASRKLALWNGIIIAGGLAERRDLAIFEILASVAELVELYGKIAQDDDRYIKKVNEPKQF